MGYKLSKYLVSSSDGRLIKCFSTNKGQLVTINQQQWEKLQSHNLDGLTEKEVLLAIESGVLVDEDVNEFQEIINYTRKSINDNKSLGVMIVPTAFCPLGCNLNEYGGYCGQVHAKESMNLEKQAILVKSITEGILPKHRNLSITWFGGEPLAATHVIRHLSSQLIEVANKNNLSYNSDLTTGGTLLTHQVAQECYFDFKINAINVSLDGPKEVHDSRRGGKNGKPSFDTVVSNLESIINDSSLDNLHLAIRCNIDSRNIARVPELISFLSSMNWQKRVELYFVPVHSWGNQTNTDIRLSIEEFAGQEILWFEQMIGAGFTPSLLPGKKAGVCRVVSSDKVVVGHNGEIHRCTESPLTKNFWEYDLKSMTRKEVVGLNQSQFDKLGQVGELPLFDKKNTWPWVEAVERGQYPCSECEFLPCCGGACPLAWMNGDMPCPSYKFNLKQRLELFPRINEPSNNQIQRIGFKQKYSPLGLLSSRNELSDKTIEIFDNFLISARIRASLGEFAIAKKQYDYACLVKNELSFKPVILHLANSALSATKAYLFYKNGDKAESKNQLIDAVKSLRAAKRLDYSLQTTPAELQMLVNLTRINVEESTTLLESLSNYLKAHKSFNFSDLHFDWSDEMFIDEVTANQLLLDLIG